MPRHFWNNGFLKTSTPISINLNFIIFWTPKNVPIPRPTLFPERFFIKTNISINPDHFHKPQDQTDISGRPDFHSENVFHHDFPGGATAATATAEEFLGMAHPHPTSRPQEKYPRKGKPSLRYLFIYISILIEIAT